MQKIKVQKTLHSLYYFLRFKHSSLIYFIFRAPLQAQTFVNFLNIIYWFCTFHIMHKYILLEPFLMLSCKNQNSTNVLLHLICSSGRLQTKDPSSKKSLAVGMHDSGTYWLFTNKNSADPIFWVSILYCSISKRKSRKTLRFHWEKRYRTSCNISYSVPRSNCPYDVPTIPCRFVVAQRCFFQT